MAGSKTLELSIKIAGKVDKSLIKAINAAQSNVSSLSTTLSHVGAAGLAAMGAMATGTVAAIAKCTDAAGEFENQMADVVKYVGGLADKAGQISSEVWSRDEGGNGQTYAENYAAMADAIKDLSTQIPYTEEDLTRLAAAAGQSGKSMQDIFNVNPETGKMEGFLLDVARMGTAWDISADQAGDWAAKWEVAFSMTHDEVMELADQINYLGANNATTAAEIGEVVNRAAGLGQVAGMDVDFTAALATAMLATGTEASRAATSINRMYINLTKGASATKAQKEVWESLGMTAQGVAQGMQGNATGTLLSVFEAIQNLPEANRLTALNTLFGGWAAPNAAKLNEDLTAYKQALMDVQDPSKFHGSMQREFVIKSETSGALDTRMGNAWNAFQIDIGNAFLPAKKSISLAIIDILDQLRNMPELPAAAETMAAMFSAGIHKVGDALENAMPVIQKALGFLADHGPQVAETLGKIALGFAAMKFAPGIEGLLTGAGGLLLGTRTPSGNGGAGGRTGGLLGAVRGLYTGGQNAVRGAATGVANLAGRAATGTRNFVGATLGTMALTERTGVGGFLGTAAGALGTGLAHTGPGRYLGGVGSAIGNVLNVSGLAGLARGTVHVGGEILSGISQATGLSNAANAVRGGVGTLVGGARTLGGRVLQSRPVQAVGNVAGRVVNSAPARWAGRTAMAGAGLWGTAFGPIASGAMSTFGSIAAGALPVVGAISGIIASLGLFHDKLDGLRPAIGNIFGEKGLSVFDNFKTVVDGVFGIFETGDVKGSLSGVRQMLVGSYDPNTESYSGGMFSGTKGAQVAQTFDNVTGAVQPIVSGIAGAFQEGGLANSLSGVRESLFGSYDPNTEGMMGGIFTGNMGTMLAGTFDGIVSMVQPILTTIGQVVTFANTTVRPIIESIFNFVTQTVMPVILQTFNTAAPIIGSILSNIGTAVMTVAQTIGTVIQAVLPIIQNIISVVLSIASVVVPAVLAGIDALSAGIIPVVEGIQTVFTGLIDFITGVFTGNWEQAWNAVKDIFGGAFDALVGLLKMPMNGVISLINRAIEGINSLGLTIPEWVPIIGGKSFSINIPKIPLLAQGGFTNGVSIAGEAGREAVISFQSGVRGQNIDTWVTAGRMLGVSGQQAAAAVSVPALPSPALMALPAPAVRLRELPDGASPGRSDGGTITITYAPVINISGGESRAEFETILREDKARFEAWFRENYQRMRRDARKARW